MYIHLLASYVEREPYFLDLHQHLFENPYGCDYGEMSHLGLLISFLGQFLTDDSSYGLQE